MGIWLSVVNRLFGIICPSSLVIQPLRSFVDHPVSPEMSGHGVLKTSVLPTPSPRT